MRRKRDWYLRKTPQDHIIEEIMLQQRCTQQKAEEIYIKQLQKNKKLRNDSDSPQRISKVPGNEDN